MVLKRKRFRRRLNSRKLRKVSYKIKSFVKRQLDKNIEDKTVTISLPASFSSISTTPVEYNWCQISQGLDTGNRIGRRIRVKSLYFRGIVGLGASQIATDDPYNCLRIILATWKGNTTTPLASVAGSSVNTVYHVRSGYPLLMKKYADKLVALNTSSGNVGGGYTPVQRKVEFFKKFKHLYINFGDNLYTSADKTLVLSMVSDSGAVPNPGFHAGYARMVYEDA